MPTRTLTAEISGPITIDAGLLGHDGVITVRAEPGCDRAWLTVRTADETGPGADAVWSADLHQSDTVLNASVQGTSVGGGSTVVTGGNRGSVVVQSCGTVTGSVTGVVMIGGNVVAGDVIVNGQRGTAGRGMSVVQGASPVEIVAVVPEGSEVIARTQVADITVVGAVKTVTADTQSGDVRIGQATQVKAETQSGDLRLTRVTNTVEAATMSGDIRIRDFTGTATLRNMSGDIGLHATNGGAIAASTMSGDITITATQTALDQGLSIQTRTMSGHVDVPQHPYRTST